MNTPAAKPGTEVMAEPTPEISLEDRAILQVAGADAHDLLDRLVTSDLSGLEPGAPAIRAGLLTPQGKILFEMFVARADAGTLLIDVDAGLAEDLAKRLAMYRLRADAEITDVSDTHATVASWVPPDDFGTFWHADEPRAFLAAYEPKRLVILRSALPSRDEDGPAAEDVYDHLIEIGIGWQGDNFGSGEVFPHDVNWDVIGAVAFDKGCFIGQEVVSRTRHKAVPRRRLVQLFAEDQALKGGTEVKAGTATLGTVGGVHTNGHLALAVLRIDRAIGALNSGDAITADDVTLQIDPAAIERYREAAAA